ncbi:integration host factor, actinobacterial type [Nonomuraea sp. JJY05]|uniref:integration host factor, actinobacterial type n=1 Tax=Nonomuraea sp. JJY05 TaxID=3350255 RepID=UPI00373EA24F
MALPALTAEQRAQALENAAAARKARGELFEGLRSGETTLTEVFDRAAGGEELVKRTRVSQILRALPGNGPARVAALMATCGVAEKRRVGGSGELQRQRLLVAVEV